MKRLSIFNLLAVLFLSHSIFAQTYITQVKTSTGKWGYATIKNELIIPATFEKGFPFTSNVATVFDPTKKQFYFLKGNGDAVMPEINDFTIMEGFFGIGAILFADGLIPVKQNKKWGYLNTSGKIAIPVKYDAISVFDGGYAVVKTGDKYSIIDVKGTETPVTISGLTDLKHFSEGLAPYKTSDDKTGFIDNKGNIVIAAAYKTVGYFTGGLAWVKGLDGKVGYIDTKGTWIIKPTFDDAKDFDPASGLARVKTADKWGYIDKTGKILNVDTESFGDFSNGLAQGKKAGKLGFYNTKGEWVIPAQFDGVRDFKNGYAAAKQGDKWGIIDTQGKWVINPTYDGIRDMELVK